MDLFKRMLSESISNVDTKMLSESASFYTDGFMDEDRFWQIIEASKSRAKEYYLQQDELANELYKLPPHDIILFNNQFRRMREEANAWKIWYAIEIILGTHQEEVFFEFREWLVAQGKDFFFGILKNPEELIALDPGKIDLGWEGIGYVPTFVYEKLTGNTMPVVLNENSVTKGEKWGRDSDEFRKNLPRLYAKYIADTLK
jgi:Protein of unknown function (DUF4240)